MTDFIAMNPRFVRNPARTQPETNRLIAILTASILTLVAISCASLGLWRMGADLDRAGDFVFRTGFLSHWQVWIGAAAGVQYASWRLTRHARIKRTPLR